ncbi:MAG: molecular chaperone [Acidobacteria bacterium]|nr:MAG: molecular chaperone [Acidobacteriota bacterium]
MTRWDPLRDLATMQNRLNRFVRESYSPEGPEEALNTTTFAPPVDTVILEVGRSVGRSRPSPTHVRIEGNTLTVHGERKIEKEEKEENFRRIERQYGSFTRSFTLPSSVDPAQVNADYEKGVLKIQLAKRAEAKPKQIKVNVRGEKMVEGKVHGKAA